MKHKIIRLSVIIASLIFASVTCAGVMDDIGYARLAAELGSALPDGSGNLLTQTEAPVEGHWMPDSEDPEFTGKTLTDRTGAAAGVSAHATGVGKYLYGNSLSQCPGAVQIDNYEAGDWIGIGFLGTGYLLSGPGTPFQPNYDHSAYPWILASPSRVANHSWVGAAADSDPLRRLDFVVETDEFIQVAGISNSSSARSLWNSAFNVIAVGRSDGGYTQYTLDIDTVYHAGLTRPHLVAPKSTTSAAAPFVAAACSLLVETGCDPDLSTDPLHRYTTDRNNVIIYNAGRSEVVKAAIMAGADRVTHNTSTSDLLPYRETGYYSDNGLDARYGAGQLNIYNSYFIIAGGEQNSLEDEPSGNGVVGMRGFDFDPAFGGANNTNTTATYTFTPDQNHRRLYAALVWNIDIAGGEWRNFDNTATLHHLNLSLFDVSDPDVPLAIAASGSEGENSENLWVGLLPDHQYEMRVAAQGEPFEWDFALAWRLDTPPDSDDDGLDDDWEVRFGLNPTDSGDALQDTDSDGLTALDEYTNGTRPDTADSDADGADDGTEITAGTHPLDPDDYPVPAVAGFSLIGCLFQFLILFIAGIFLLSRKNDQEWTQSVDSGGHVC